MSRFDTSMGGREKAFPDTVWSMVSQIGNQSEDTRRKGIETLCRQYWKPVYQYIRLKWTKSNDDTKDITQAFFLWLMDSDAIQHCTRERGGFRNYLKFLLKRFVSHEHEAMNRLKRGGGRKIVELDGAVLEGLASDARTTDPEKAFDRAWFSEVMKSSIQKVGRQLREAGKEKPFLVYTEYELMAKSDRPTQLELAEKHGIKSTDVANYLHTVRAAVREEMIAQFRETTSDLVELNEECAEFSRVFQD